MFYKFHYYNRFTRIGPQNSTFNTICMKVDSVGLFINYSDKKDLVTETIRRHLVGRCDNIDWIRAESPHHMLKAFYGREGALIGGKDRSQKAIWINTEYPIIELPDCEFYENGECLIGFAEDYYQCGISYAGTDWCPVARSDSKIYHLLAKGDGLNRYDILRTNSGKYTPVGMQRKTIEGVDFILTQNSYLPAKA